MEVFRELPGAPAPVGPYSVAVRVGDLIFCAGQIALDPLTGKLVDGGLEAQIRRVLENTTAVLASVESGWDMVAMTTIFLTDIADGKLVNEIYSEYVSTDAPPARQTIAVKALPLGALVEISVIATVDNYAQTYSENDKSDYHRRSGGVG